MKLRMLQLLAVAIPLASALSGDTIVFRNGAQMSGRIISAENGSVTIEEDQGQSRRFEQRDIRRIEFSAPSGMEDRHNDGNEDHSTYDKYRDRPDYRDSQPQGGAIGAKYQDMVRAGIGLGNAISVEQSNSDGRGHMRVYQNGSLYWTRESGAHEVHGAIREEYLRMGGENSRLGYPVSDEMPAPDGVGRTNRFEHGSIYWNPRAGARVEFIASGGDRR